MNEEDLTLCQLEADGFLVEQLEEYKKLVRDARYLCTSCGRVAQMDRWLCKPVDLYDEAG